MSTAITVTAAGETSAGATTVTFSGGRGNAEVDVEQVHLALRFETEKGVSRLVQGWFPAADVEKSLEAARSARKPVILSEPALTTQ